ELVAILLDRALRGELLKSLPDCPSIRPVDACLELEFHLVGLRQCVCENVIYRERDCGSHPGRPRPVQGSGMRRSEFCRGRGLSFSTLDRPIVGGRLGAPAADTGIT